MMSDDDMRDNLEAGASFYLAFQNGDVDGDTGESSTILRQPAHLLTMKLKSALSLFTLGAAKRLKRTDAVLENDDFSATSVVSDGEDSEEDEAEEDTTSKPRRAIRSLIRSSITSSDAPKGAKSSPTTGHRIGMTITPSFVRSMNQYMLRRTLAQEAVDRGQAFAEYDEEKPHLVQQADLDMYTEEKQLMRSKIKRSTRFQAEVKSLWALVGPQGSLSKSQYIKV